jgi:hypothetical protein
LVTVPRYQGQRVEASMPALTRVSVTGIAAEELAHVAPVNASWNESSITWNNKPAAGSKFWSFSLGSLANQSVNVTSNVQSWSSNPSSNYGWKITTNSILSSTFSASAYLVADKRPKLTVTYQRSMNNANTAQMCTKPSSALIATGSIEKLP